MTTSHPSRSIAFAVIVFSLSFASFSCDSETNELFQPVIEDIHTVEYDPIFKEKPADPLSFEKASKLTKAEGEIDAQRKLDPTPQENPNQQHKVVKDATKATKVVDCKSC